MRSSNIGGQAVIEGIMMRHKDEYAIAVRKPDGEIEVKKEKYRSVFGNLKFMKAPVFRGVASFVDSLVKKKRDGRPCQKKNWPKNRKSRKKRKN